MINSLKEFSFNFLNIIFMENVSINFVRRKVTIPPFKFIANAQRKFFIISPRTVYHKLKLHCLPHHVLCEHRNEIWVIILSLNAYGIKPLHNFAIPDTKWKWNYKLIRNLSLCRRMAKTFKEFWYLKIVNFLSAKVITNFINFFDFHQDNNRAHPPTACQKIFIKIW